METIGNASIHQGLWLGGPAGGFSGLGCVVRAFLKSILQTSEVQCLGMFRQCLLGGYRDLTGKRLWYLWCQGLHANPEPPPPPPLPGTKPKNPKPMSVRLGCLCNLCGLNVGRMVDICTRHWRPSYAHIICTLRRSPRW